MTEALGKRIDDPAALRLASAIGNKPFQNATPSKRSDIGDRKRLGIEAVADMVVDNRNHWPPRKEGRKWLTWVTNVFLYPNYAGTLPDGFGWQMNDAALSARLAQRGVTPLDLIRFTLPSPWPGVTAMTTLGDDGRPREVYLAVAEEWQYATRFPDSLPENCVEDAFFATWFSLSGVLRESRVAPTTLASIQ